MTSSGPKHKRLFAYGELTDPAHLRRLLGRSLPMRDAVLPGYARVVLPGFRYPLAMPTRRGALRGKLIDDLDVWDLQALDAWETTAEGLYRASYVRVELAPGEEVTAMAYLGNEPAVRAWLGQPAAEAAEPAPGRVLVAV